ncbi:hypothetical protein Y032_0731g1902 [Ancylostoma ceylanicum]|nr:hypothetical protein Y032_0731g1902 [Ancylostoma ceylanicum]
MVPVHPRTDPANPRFEIRGQVGGRAHSIHSAILDLLNIATVGFISFFFENNGYVDTEVSRSVQVRDSEHLHHLLLFIRSCTPLGDVGRRRRGKKCERESSKTASFCPATSRFCPASFSGGPDIVPKLKTKECENAC